MSDKYVAMALGSGAAFSTEERLALILLGDSANDDGQVRAVSEDRIAGVMQIKPADVQRILHGLHEKGFLQTYAEGIQIVLD
ncbi:MAG: helix-turn-helix domain-containing protein [Rhizomicrobium sp.]|jgi:DNA-binding IscR family transcriptional regulator